MRKEQAFLRIVAGWLKLPVWWSAELLSALAIAAMPILLFALLLEIKTPIEAINDIKENQNNVFYGTVGQSPHA